MKLLKNPSYKEYLAELERVKQERCKSGDHAWTHLKNLRVFCANCGVNG